MAFKNGLTEASLLESELRLRVHRRIDGRRLPLAVRSRHDGSSGPAKVCCVCDQPITCEHVEYEIVDFRGSYCLTLNFHSSCHLIWQQECVNRVADAKRPKPRN
jgi:hypothetical protein